MKIGSHVSMKAPNYLVGSVEEALSYNANAFMIYTGPPSNSKRVDVDKLKIEEALEFMKQHDMDEESIVVHAPYIINLANSAKPETAKFGVDFLIEELKRVEKMGAKYCVLHPGSHVKMGVDVGLEWIVNGLNEIFDAVDNSVYIALETMAGKGSECGRTFEELAYIIEHVKDNRRLKVCLDTCHIHDAGYDVSDFDGVLDEFDRVIGLDRLAVIHVNDSKNPQGSHKDRHENIGKGTIGFEALYKVVHNPRIDHVTKILETPYIDGKAPYKEEIERLREIV